MWPNCFGAAKKNRHTFEKRDMFVLSRTNHKKISRVDEQIHFLKNFFNLIVTQVSILY